MGARIIQVARDRGRGQEALKRLGQRGPEVAHSIYYADLSRLSEMKRVASEIAEAEPHIDVLMNNAGAMFGSRQLTEDGLEFTFALNHMAYFVLTHGLRKRLVTSAPARVVNTASDAHGAATLDFNDLQSAHAYRGNFVESLRFGGPGFKVYASSKLCNILFHERTGPAVRIYGGNCQLPASRLCCYSFRRSDWRTDLFRDSHWQTLCAFSAAGR